ncbi:MAG TPA: protein tyrosine phosphatase [Candidatus Cloacimonetes bacterium]|nr:protein tyrosine phosphatase [Candidatus Cloacimonadota bacterium]
MKRKTLINPGLRKLRRRVAKLKIQSSKMLHFTGNMWGIGARLSDEAAIDEISRLKRRSKNGMVVLIYDIAWFEENGVVVPPRLYRLMQQYYPGNISFAFETGQDRFEHISVENKTAFRVPGDPLLRLFIQELGEPMVSTSINYSGLPAEEDIQRIERNYSSWFDFALYPNKGGAHDDISHSTLIEYNYNEINKEETLNCIREGSVPFHEVKKSFARPMVMFVCTANICRSPIAEKLFRQKVEQQELAIDTDSSGLMQGGHLISLSSMQLLMARGILEAQEHVSKQITPEMVDSSWLVLTMEVRQRDILRESYPQHARKILTLNEITGYSGDVEDPYGYEKPRYEETFEIIEDRLDILINKIKNEEILL